MAEQTYEDYLSFIRVTLSSDAVIKAPCCGLSKPVFAIRPRAVPVQELRYSDVGFLCDACTTDKVRMAMGLINALASMFPNDKDWDVVRYERNKRLGLTDHFDTPRIRERINPDKLAEIDEYRDWLRDAPSTYATAAEALAAIVNKPIPN